MMVRERRDIKPILLNLGVALSLSFASFIFSRFRTKLIKPSKPPSFQSPRSSEHNNDESGGGRPGFRYEIHASERTPSSSHILSIVSEKHEENFSPSSRGSGDKDRYLLPEFNELVKEMNLSPPYPGISPKKDVDMARLDLDLPKSLKNTEKDEYEQEIKHLRNMVKILREKERNLEFQLLEYYGLKEQETSVMELHNRLKINNMEAKLFHLKIESLQADNRRLQSQVADYAKVVAELEAAKGRIKILKKKHRNEAESKDQILTLQKTIQKLQDREHTAATFNVNDPNTELTIQRLNKLENEAEELRNVKTRLQMENSELSRKLESSQVIANSVLEVPKEEELKEMNHRLRKENEDLSKDMERLQADRCADVEELVYLRWINACLRFELRNYQPQPGKDVARDLSKTLSPKSEEKAKKLILEYANTEGMSERGMINLSDLDSDKWSSSQTSYFTDEYDDSPIDNTNAPSTPKANKTKFFSKLVKLFREKGKVAYVDETMGTCSSASPNFTTSQSDGSSRQSLDVQKLRKLSLDDVKDLENRQRFSDVGSMFSYKKFGSGAESSATDSPSEIQNSESRQKSELLKYAEVLRSSHGGKNPKLHTKSKSFSSY